MPRDLDYAPLGRRQGLRSRLRAVWESNTWVWSMTLGLVMVVLPTLAVFVLPSDYEGDAGFAIFMAMIALAGLYVVGMVLHVVAGDGSLDELARANELELTRGVTATHYAGSRFRDGSLLVHRSVRTPGEGFVEVGDTLSIDAPRRGDGTRRGEVFLRVGLAGPTRPGQQAGLVDPALDARITAWAGPWTVECAEQELTLHGRQALDPRRPDRVREGFALGEELRRRADELAVAAPGEHVEVTPSGIPVPATRRRDPSTGRRSPLLVIAGLLLFLLLGSLGIAQLASWAESVAGGRSGLVAVALGLGLVVVLAVAGALHRAVSSPSRRRAAGTPGTPSTPGVREADVDAQRRVGGSERAS